jgi:hypothetical protein
MDRSLKPTTTTTPLLVFPLSLATTEAVVGQARTALMKAEART